MKDKKIADAELVGTPHVTGHGSEQKRHGECHALFLGRSEENQLMRSVFPLYLTVPVCWLRRSTS